MNHVADLLRKSIHLVPWKYRQRVKDVPLVCTVQRFAVNRLLGKQAFLHTVDAGPARGLRIWIQLPEDKQIWTGTYEAEFASVLSKAIRKGDVCLDIGGHRGFFSAVCALAGARVVHVFEPLPSNVQRIEALIHANPELPVVLHSVAVGADIGETEFVALADESMGKISESDFQPETPPRDVFRVRIETLDALRAAGAIQAPDVIKIDVEGAEAMVLQGAAAILRERRPRLFVEVHSRSLARQCNEILSGFGYTVNVVETGMAPDFDSDPEVCHFVAVAEIA